jgi:hypothetical protein
LRQIERSRTFAGAVVPGRAAFRRNATYVVRHNFVEHYGHAIVTANVDGDYDKRGLPDPLGCSLE